MRGVFTFSQVSRLSKLLSSVCIGGLDLVLSVKSANTRGEMCRQIRQLLRLLLRWELHIPRAVTSARWPLG